MPPNAAALRVLLVDSPESPLDDLARLLERDHVFAERVDDLPEALASGDYAGVIALVSVALARPMLRAELAGRPVVWVTPRWDEANAATKLSVPLESVLGLPWSDIREVARMVRLTISTARPLPRPANSAALVQIGDDPKWSSVVAAATRVAESDVNVLLVGPTGSGKSTLARVIHTRSGRGRAGRPFVVADLPAVPPSLHASELFGHERGAFTGADRRRDGKFAQAAGGTLLIDEIGELAPDTQMALLRSLQERVYQPLGGSIDQPLSARLVFATNRDLDRSVRDGTFRKDLLYRLAPVVFRLPSLVERPGDILPLALGFATRFAGRPNIEFSQAVEEWIHAHPWPGNVRELEQFVQAGVSFLSSDRTVLEMDDFQYSVSMTYPTSDSVRSVVPSMTLDEYELQTRREYLQALVRHYDFDWQRIAEHADRNKNRLRESARELGILERAAS